MKKIMWILGLILICTACTPPKPIPIPDDVVKLAEDAQRNHQTIEKQPILEESYRENNHLDDYFTSFDYLLNHNKKSSPVSTFSYQQAKEDIDSLFQLFRNLYGNYETFGGDTRFKEAKEAILTELSSYEKLTYEDFSYIVRKNLSFIEDSHVQIDFSILQDIVLLYTSNDTLDITKQGNVYYHEGKKIQAIQDDKDVAAYMKPTLQDGKETYRLYVQSDLPPKDLLITYEDDTQDRIAMKVITPDYDEDATFHREEMQSIPYIAVTRMAFPEVNSSSKKEAEKFLESAEDFKESPVAILDLRGNTGGNLFLAEQWAKAFTNETIQGNIISLLKLPLEDKRFHQGIQWSQDPEEILSSTMYKKLNDLYYITNNNRKERKMMDNDTILFVLQDANTASAAEHLIDYLHNVDNVIFVGTPTRGMLKGSSMATVYLEHTSLQVSLGNMRNSISTQYGKEYYGLYPDLWVEGDALEEVLKLFPKENER